MKNSIPEELRMLPQWVLWRYVTRDGKSTKIPFSSNGRYASVTDPTTWASFEDATKAVGYDGIGFVLSKDDPYSIIDLDNKPDKPCTPEQLTRHQKIYESFVSYAELSVSGTGVHIIVKGKIPAGVHRDNVEVYSEARYMVCTGNVLRDSPITDQQELLDTLFKEMTPAPKSVLEEVEETYSDQEIIERAMGATNAAKFNALCSGDQTGYESQSEADFALLSMLAFYSQSNEQVRRLFRMTNLGKREKAVRNNTYLNLSLNKIRAQQPPSTDLSKLTAPRETFLPSPSIAPITRPETVAPSAIALPMGLVGEIAHYIYVTSHVPIQEVALAAAITLCAGIVARSYNTNTGQGLNLYVVLLALAGSGKEGALAGVDRLITAVRPKVPMADQFIGPARFASGQALIRTLDSQPCFISIQDEFGKTVQRLNHPKASPTDMMLKQVLLDIYGKSGHDRTLYCTAYSDSEKNTKPVRAPNVSILGVSTPEDFFDGLDESSITEGLVPRLLVIEHTGDLPYPNRAPKPPPSEELTQRFADFITAAVALSNKGACCVVPCEDQVTARIVAYEHEVTDWRNANKENAFGLLKQRLCEQATRLATLLAVSVNQANPRVTVIEFEWALRLVERSFGNISRRFQNGEVGRGDAAKAEGAIRSAIEVFLDMTPEKRKTYKTQVPFQTGEVIPYSYLHAKLKRVQPFKTSVRFLDEGIKTLINTGALEQIPSEKVFREFKINTNVYHLGQNW